MSYYASGSGEITFKGEADKFKEQFEALGFEDFDIGSENNNTVYISLPLTMYDEDKLYTLLKDIAPSTKAGYINYTGEDGTIWKFEFNKKVNQWIEFEGVIEYRNPRYLM